MSDTMLFGVLKMPFEMAMKDEISRLQYYARVQELVGRFEAQQQAEPVPRWDVDEDNPDSLAKHPAFRATPKQQAEPVLLECVTCGTVYADGVPPQVPVQEHITHITWDERGVRTVNGIPDDAPQQQQAEPVACRSCQDIGGNWAWKCNLCGEVDESREPEPPQRQWVGLTEAELQFQLVKHRQLVNAHYDRAENTNIITETFDGTSFYNEVVAILKEKNNG